MGLSKKIDQATNHPEASASNQMSVGLSKIYSGDESTLKKLAKSKQSSVGFSKMDAFRRRINFSSGNSKVNLDIMRLAILKSQREHATYMGHEEGIT